jgi:hypothetical protein
LNILECPLGEGSVALTIHAVNDIAS